MYMGHYGVPFAVRPILRDVPLWVWFIATQWLDILWAVLVLGGVEKFRIVPGFTESSPLDLFYQPYTHSLPGALVWSLLLGLIVALCLSRRRTRPLSVSQNPISPLSGHPAFATITLLIAAASFSHWLLDFIVHTRDLPLYDDSAKVGLGLGRHLALSLALELMLLGLGAWIYARRMPFATTAGRCVFWAFITILAAFQVGYEFGPLPASPKSFPVAALASYALLTLTAAFVEWYGVVDSLRHRESQRSD
jgi:hypothetical protein